MASTRDMLKAAASHMAESTGARKEPSAKLPVPQPQSRDAGRRMLRNVGRIAIDQVTPDPAQPRQHFTEQAIESLAASIRTRGQFSPIRVRWSDELDRWVIIFGERRWRAVQRAGLAEIDCVFSEGELTPTQILEQQLIENCLREDLQPIEEAKAFERLLNINGWTRKQLAAALQIPATQITRTLTLLKLPDDIQQQVADGEISARTAYELTKAPTEAVVRRLARQAAGGKLTTDAVSKVVRRRRKKQVRRGQTLRQVFVSETGWQIAATAEGPQSYHDLEQALQEALDEVRHRINNGLRLF